MTGEEEEEEEGEEEEARSGPPHDYCCFTLTWFVAVPRG